MIVDSMHYSMLNCIDATIIIQSINLYTKLQHNTTGTSLYNWGCPTFQVLFFSGCGHESITPTNLGCPAARQGLDIMCNQSDLSLELQNKLRQAVLAAVGVVGGGRHFPQAVPATGVSGTQLLEQMFQDVRHIIKDAVDH